MWNNNPYKPKLPNPMGQNPMPSIPQSMPPAGPTTGQQQLNHLYAQGMPNQMQNPEQQTMRHLAHFNNLKRMLKRTI